MSRSPNFSPFYMFSGGTFASFPMAPVENLFRAFSGMNTVYSPQCCILAPACILYFIYYSFASPVRFVHMSLWAGTHSLRSVLRLGLWCVLSNVLPLHPSLTCWSAPNSPTNTLLFFHLVVLCPFPCSLGLQILTAPYSYLRCLCDLFYVPKQFRRSISDCGFPPEHSAVRFLFRKFCPRAPIKEFKINFLMQVIHYNSGKWEVASLLACGGCKVRLPGKALAECS